MSEIEPTPAFVSLAQTVWGLAVGLCVAGSTGGCRDERSVPRAKPVPTDAQPKPIDAFELPIDAAPPLGLGPYANLHAEFVARCPIELLHAPSDRPDEPSTGVGYNGRGCTTKAGKGKKVFYIEYTERDAARGLDDEEKYRRISGNVNEISQSYFAPSLSVMEPGCRSLPDDTARLYQLTSGISDVATARLAATIRTIDLHEHAVDSKSAYARIRVEDRVIYVYASPGHSLGRASFCGVWIDAGQSIGVDPRIIDVPLAELNQNEKGN